MAILDNGIEELAAGQQIVFAHTANNVVGVLAVACGSSDTTISLSPGGGALFPNAPFYCSIEFEVLWCLSKSGDNLIVQRGQDGTVAQAHAVAVAVEMRNNAGLWSDAYNGINAVSADVGTLQSNILNKTALPPDTTFNNATQELTHKTIDLADSSKQNVIIGNVQPDPAALVYQNILVNGGFDDWITPTSITLSAGTPTSGFRSASLANGWTLYGINDSAITGARDAANTDPAYPSGYDLLLNVSTVQGTDYCSLTQDFVPGSQIAPNDLYKIVGNPISISARVKLISGNVQMRFRWVYNDGSGSHYLTGTLTTITNTYSTIKFENQILVPTVNVVSCGLLIDFQGVGQVALDNVMMIVGAVATTHRPSFPSIANNRLAPNVQRQNLLTNGGFEIWQRGNPISIVSEGQYHADRWQCVRGTSGATVTISKAVSQFGANQLQIIVSGGTVNAATPITIYQNIVTSSLTDILDLRGRTLSASAKCLGTVANALRIGLFDNPSFTWSRYHSGISQYEYLGSTLTISPSATNVQARFVIEAPGTYWVDDFCVVVGSVPADYVPMHPADDLARCLRYYQAWFASTTTVLCTGQCFGTINAAVFLPFSAKFPGAPTITVSAPADWMAVGAGGSGNPMTIFAASYPKPESASFTVNTGGGLAAGNATYVQNTNGNARVSAEYNP